MKYYSHFVFSLLGAIVLYSCGGPTAEAPKIVHHLEKREAGLRIDTVFVSTEYEQPTANTFVYGQTFYTNFKGLNGFTLKDGDLYPDIEVHVLSKKGDTILYENNLLGGLAQPQDLPALNGSLILANPIWSGESYTAFYKVYDTKGSGAVFTEMEFSLVSDRHITISENGLRAKEVYLFNNDSGTVITNGVAPTETVMTLNFQRLEGYRRNAGKINLGMSIVVTDAMGLQITEVDDALAGTEYDAINDEDVIQATLKLNKGRSVNPITWRVRLWDKNSDAEMTATAEMNSIANE